MQAQHNHLILLGGIGGDSHSVGITILRQSLLLNGYRVHYLGIQNHLKDFFHFAPYCNVAMISNIDGHARHYLHQFSQMRMQCKTQGPLWYLGGNLHIDDATDYTKYFLDMGFDRVFVKFTDIDTILKVLEGDLYGMEPKADVRSIWEQMQHIQVHLSKTAADDPHEWERLKYERRDVLEQWKTGYKAKSLNDNAEFLARQASFPKIQALVISGRLPILIQPRAGVPLVDEQIRLFKAFKNLGIQVLSYQVDSLTRNNDYPGVEEALGKSRLDGATTLNGFPVINHGVPQLRRIISEVNVPLQTRHSTRDPRLLAEISFAGGVTAFEGGSICYNIPYYKDYPLDESIRTWQYVDRLAGLYYERFGIVLDREFFGTLTGTLIPPCLAIAVDIIEAILAIRQGVKCVSLGYAEQGNRVQDIAAVRTLAQMAREIVHNLGYKDIQINTVFHQYMAAFPQDEKRAEELIYHSAVTGALTCATRMLVKSPVEAYRIPSLSENVRGINLARGGTASAIQERVDEVEVSKECAVIRREVQAILESIIFCGGGSIAEGVILGFRKGLIDIPFSPSIYNRGLVITARDLEGAVRFLSTGNLPFDRDLREFHYDKMRERRQAEGGLSEKQGYLLVEQDVLQVARGSYKHWPLSR